MGFRVKEAVASPPIVWNRLFQVPVVAQLPSSGRQEETRFALQKQFTLQETPKALFARRRGNSGAGRRLRAKPQGPACDVRTQVR